MQCRIVQHDTFIEGSDARKRRDLLAGREDPKGATVGLPYCLEHAYLCVRKRFAVIGLAIRGARIDVLCKRIVRGDTPCKRDSGGEERIVRLGEERDDIEKPYEGAATRIFSTAAPMATYEALLPHP